MSDRQNFIKKFAKSKRPNSAHAADPSLPLAVEFRYKNQIVMCRDDFALDFCASYWPAAQWTENKHPEQRILVLTNRHDHAQMLLHETLRYLKEFDPDLDPLVRNQREITNGQGGVMFFATIGSCIAGRQFDTVVINEAGPPRALPEFQKYCEYLEILVTRLAPK